MREREREEEEQEGQKVTGPTIIGFGSKRKRRRASLQFPCVCLYFFSLSFSEWCVHCIAQSSLVNSMLLPSSQPSRKKHQHTQQTHFLFLSLFLFYPPTGQPPFLFLPFFINLITHYHHQCK